MATHRRNAVRCVCPEGDDVALEGALAHAVHLSKLDEVAERDLQRNEDLFQNGQTRQFLQLQHVPEVDTWPNICSVRTVTALCMMRTCLRDTWCAVCNIHLQRWIPPGSHFYLEQ